MTPRGRAAGTAGYRVRLAGEGPDRYAGAQNCGLEHQVPSPRLARSAVIVVALVAACPPVQAEPLNFMIWEDFIDPSILDGWTARSGIRVREVHIDNGDQRDAILGDYGVGVDLSVMNEGSIALFGHRGLLEPITPASVPAMLEYPQDRLARCAGYGIPYFWGTMGILYRRDKVVPPPTSWRDLMQPEERYHGHVAMFDDARVAFVAPLRFLGLSANAADDAALRRAYAALEAQAPAVLTYDYIITAMHDPAIGPDIWLGLGYSGDQYTLDALSGDGEGTWGYVIPSEGSIIWQACLSVIASSGQKAAALDLVNTIASRDMALRNAITLRTPPSNPAAEAALPAALRADPALYPPEATLARCEVLTDLPAEAIMRRRRIVAALVNALDAR